MTVASTMKSLLLAKGEPQRAATAADDAHQTAPHVAR